MSGCEGLSHSRAGHRGLAKAHSSAEGQEGILTSFSTSSQPRQYKIIYFPSLDDCFSNTLVALYPLGIAELERSVMAGHPFLESIQKKLPFLV